jgi:UDP-N-acetylmuramoyl-L-alanyl-D-glutamate--2,6-diaminopimelate ligase
MGLKSLAALLAAVETACGPCSVKGLGDLDSEVGAIRVDSRLVRPGDVLVATAPDADARRRHAVDGAGRGAIVVITPALDPWLAIPQVRVRNPRVASAAAAAWLDDYPSRHLLVVGVTGTDGKSTTCSLAARVLEAGGRRTGLATTVQTLVGGAVVSAASRMTTPDAPDIQELLAHMRRAGDAAAVVEASSHGLAQERLAMVAFDVAVLTNIGHEHLDYHRTLAEYRAAKRRLFTALRVTDANPEKGHGKWAVLNGDDRYAAEFALAAEAAGAQTVSYGITSAADVRATRLRGDDRGTRFTASSDQWSRDIDLRLPWRFNVQNALAALSVAYALGIDSEAAAEALKRAQPIAGRTAWVAGPQPFRVMIDYAHTPEALSAVLRELSPIARRSGGGVICVFGSAGDRDRQKRPKMGRIAGRWCRLVVLTEEDPRSEDPEAIAAQIADGARAAGMHVGANLLIEPDRLKAIRLAIELARPGDLILLAGKGHERTIERSTGAVAWDELAATRGALAAIGYAAVEDTVPTVD